MRSVLLLKLWRILASIVHWLSGSVNPAQEATPPPETAVPWAKPYPVPEVNLAEIIRILPDANPTVIVTCNGDPDCDLGVQLNLADAKLGKGGGSIILKGGGTITTQATVTHNLIVEPGVYRCNQQFTNGGAILLGDGVTVTASRDANLPSVANPVGDVIFVEPTFSLNKVPAVTVFQALGDTLGGPVAGQLGSKNIVIRGITFKGANEYADGGVRSTIDFGNGENCYAIQNSFLATASIGIQFGDDAHSGFHAVGGGAFDNYFDQLGAACIAVVNGQDIRIGRNIIRRPSHPSSPVSVWGGGVSGVDCETNSPFDALLNIWIFNNDIDFTDSFIANGAGNGINVQDPYWDARTPEQQKLSGNITVANNKIVGNPLSVNAARGLSNGIWIVGQMPGVVVANNYVIHSGQSALGTYGGNGLQVVDNQFIGDGTGGIAGVTIRNASGLIWKHNNMFVPEQYRISAYDPRVFICFQAAPKGFPGDASLMNDWGMFDTVGGVIPQSDPMVQTWNLNGGGILVLSKTFK